LREKRCRLGRGAHYGGKGCQEALKTVGGMIEQLRAQAEEDRDIANHLPVLELAAERRIELWVEEESWEAFYEASQR
jgi:hypothetical protein